MKSWMCGERENNMVYQWKSIAGIKADPNVAGKQFEELEHTIGLTPKNVLDANRDESAPLHNEFEWNDSVAAEKYRIDQAGQLIRMLCIKPDTDAKNQTPIRAFFVTSECKSYESINVIIKTEDKYAELKARAYAELQSFQKKYAMISELDTLMTMIDSLINE